MRDPAASIRHLNAVHGLGLRLSIDDFGTDQGISLSYLKLLPIHTLFSKPLPADDLLAFIQAHTTR